MTAGNKVDLLVKDDGSTEVLIASPKKVVIKEHRRRVCLLLLSTLLILSLTGFLVFFFMHKQHSSRKDVYQFSITIDGRPVRGEVKINRADNTVARCGTPDPDDFFLDSISDGMNEVTAVIVVEEDGRHCLIRDDKTFGYSSPPVFPPPEVLDKLLNRTSMDDVMVVMDDVIWEENTKLPVKASSLPPSIRSKCEGLPIFELTPWKLESVPGPQYKDLEADDDDDDDEEYVAEDLIDVDYDETKDEYTDRKKRQTEDDEEEVDEDDEEERPRSRASNIGNEEEYQSDHNLACCNHCRRARMQCNRVCIPSRTNNYPYYYRNCNHVECQWIIPCSYWRRLRYLAGN